MQYVRMMLGAIVASLCLSTLAAAQAVGGAQLSGTVRDSSGGAIPGAEVTVTKVDTGQTRTVFTEAAGSYSFPNLPVGPYQLKVVLEGFKTYVRDGIVLQVSSNPTIDVTLGIGALAESVTVTAAATMTETKSTGVGQVIDNLRVLEMPLNGRQATDLVFLSGMATAAPAADLNTAKNYPTTTISVAGGLANGMTYVMDGATHNDPFNNLNLPTLFPDALQEFKVESSALPARYGQHAAAAVNMVTKSGANDFHGSGFDFIRNYHFNAQNAFATSTDSLERNQFGGTLGGPIVRNKAFFFGAYQGKVEKSTPPTTINYVPTQAMLNGDFTAFASPACNSGRQIALKAPYANNQISPAQFDKVALGFAKLMPISTDPCGKVQYGIPADNTEQQALAKADFTMSQNQTVSTRLIFARYNRAATYDGQNIMTTTQL